MALDAQLTLSFLVNRTRSGIDLSAPSDKLLYQYARQFTEGSGLNQFNEVFHDTRTINASANDDLDLAGPLTNIFGQTITFTKVNGIIAVASAANVNTLRVGGLGTNGFLTWVGATGDLVVVRPGGMMALVGPDATGYAVTAATADLLRFTNGGAGTTVAYDVIIFGAV